jgi:tripartite-type tricarboxylate transporter receptor subunit TctC
MTGLRLALCIAFAFVLPLGTANAQEPYPSKPVRLIIPYPPGGITDLLGRSIAQELGKLWGQQTIVENRPGANQIIGAQVAARSAPDGYTVIMVDRGAIVLNPLLYSKLPYDAAKDFAPVIALANIANVLTANVDLPASSLQELVGLAKARPNAINYGSLGLGSLPHLDTEAFSTQAGIKLTHIPFKGLTEIMPSMMTNQIQIAFSGVPFTLPLVREGRIKALAIGSPQRSPLLPNVPTFAEAGFSGFESQTWFGLLVPSATPRPIVDKIAADVSGVISQKAFIDKFFVPVGLDLVNQGPEQFARTIIADRARYAAYIKSVNIKLD